MIIHIVRQDENLRQILEHYKIEKNDLISINRHITDWNNLYPGMKIRIPLINEDVIEILDETEPFIEDYYEKEEQEISEKDDENFDIKDDKSKDEMLNDAIEEEITEKKTNNTTQKEKNEIINEVREPKIVKYYANGYIKKI